MSFALSILLCAGALFVGLLICLEVGRRLGQKKLTEDPEAARAGVGVVEGSVFGLVGLLLAFTFSGAAHRFDERRDLVIEEVNAIDSAWQRIDMLPDVAQPAMRDGFRRYLDARIAAYKKLPDLRAAMEELARSRRIQDEIWDQAVAVCRAEPGAQVRMLILPSMNHMFEIAQERYLVTGIHPPVIIYLMLVALALAGAVLAGYGMAGSKGRHWIHWLGFAATISIALYVILDLEYPRLGLIRVDQFDQALVELRATMN